MIPVINAARGAALSNRGRALTIVLLGAALALLTFAAAAPGPADAAKARSSATPKRIVALTPFSANVLASVGVRPVAVGETLGGSNRRAAGLRGVSILPLSHPAGPNLEQLAKLNPDMVLSGPAWRRGHSAMRQLGITVRQADPTRIGNVGAHVKRLARMVGRPAAGRRLARKMNRSIRRARANIRKRPTVLLLLGVGRSSYAFLPNSWGGDLIRKAGGRMLTQGLKGRGYAKISDEFVVQRNPDVIIGVPHANASDIPAIVDHLITNPAWQTTRAVRNNRLFVSLDNSLLQPATDIAQTIRRVRALYLKNR